MTVSRYNSSSSKYCLHYCYQIVLIYGLFKASIHHYDDINKCLSLVYEDNLYVYTVSIEFKSARVT